MFGRVLPPNIVRPPANWITKQREISNLRLIDFQNSTAAARPQSIPVGQIDGGGTRVDRLPRSAHATLPPLRRGEEEQSLAAVARNRWSGVGGDGGDGTAGVRARAALSIVGAPDPTTVTCRRPAVIRFILFYRARFQIRSAVLSCIQSQPRKNELSLSLSSKWQTQKCFST